MASTLKVDNIIATDGTTAPITLSGDTATLSGTGVTFPAGHIVRTDYAYDAAANWIETTSTSYQASGIIVNAGTANTGENIIVTCNIRNSSAFQANLIATYYHKIGTSGTYADILANGSGDGERFFLKYYSNYPFQPLTLTIAHRSPSTSDDNFYQIYFKSGTSGSKARLAWYGSGIEFFAQRVTFNSSTELGL